MSEEVKKEVAKKAPAAKKPVAAKKEAAPKVEKVEKAPAKTKKAEKLPGNVPYVSDGEIRVELVAGLAGQTKRQRRTVQALGLGRKIGNNKVHKDNPAIRGMCDQVAHLVKGEKV